MKSRVSSEKKKKNGRKEKKSSVPTDVLASVQEKVGAADSTIENSM